MFGAICEGLHCDGCGKAGSAGLFGAAIAIYIASQISIEAVIYTILILVGAAVFAAVGTLLILRVIITRGPPVVYTQTDRLTYSQMKFLQTGDREWLALHGEPFVKEVNNGQGAIVGAEVVARHDHIRTR